MAQPWTAEERVSLELATRLIAAQFPSLHAERLELLGEGWDNVAYLVNGTFVFRFPRRQIAVGLLEQERRILPLVNRSVELSTPVPEFLGDPSAEFRWPFFGYRLLSGRTLSAAAPTLEQRRALAVPLARFLRQLHSIPVSEALAVGAAAHVIDKLDMTRILPEATRNLEDLRAKGFLSSLDPWRPLLDAPPPTREGIEVLCHGDLYSLHLLVDDAAQLCGVIDWGDLHLGHPAVDLAAAHLVLPRESHPCFRENYGAISDAQWELARLRALFHASTTAVYGEHQGDSKLRDGSLWALREMGIA